MVLVKEQAVGDFASCEFFSYWSRSRYVCSHRWTHTCAYAHTRACAHTHTYTHTHLKCPPAQPWDGRTPGGQQLLYPYLQQQHRYPHSLPRPLWGVEYSTHIEIFRPESDWLLELLLVRCSASGTQQCETEALVALKHLIFLSLHTDLQCLRETKRDRGRKRQRGRDRERWKKRRRERERGKEIEEEREGEGKREGQSHNGGPGNSVPI